VGADTFFVVSAGGNVLWTCDPDVITQISNRKSDFTKPTDTLGMLNLYGPTITASEEEEHRIWQESVRQAGLMLDFWNRDGGRVADMNADANRYALHVLSKAFFGKTMTWEFDAEKSHGHHLSYPEAIGAVFKYNNTIFTTLWPLLSEFTRVLRLFDPLTKVRCLPNQSA
jgi:hypothetical protein